MVGTHNVTCQPPKGDTAGYSGGQTIADVRERIGWTVL